MREDNMFSRFEDRLLKERDTLNAVSDIKNKSASSRTPYQQVKISSKLHPNRVHVLAKKGENRKEARSLGDSICQFHIESLTLMQLRA